jgi:hypothetical protein
MVEIISGLHMKREFYELMDWHFGTLAHYFALKEYGYVFDRVWMKMFLRSLWICNLKGVLWFTCKRNCYFEVMD